MSGVVLVVPRMKFLDNAGNPVSNGWLTVYAAGTTTKSNTWQDKALTTLNTNPIHLDPNGECLVFGDPTKTYKLLLQTSALVTVPGWPVDNISGAANMADATSAARDWAQKTDASVDGTDFSSKEYAQGTQAATGGSAKNWSQQTGADVTGASANDRSSKSWAQEDLTGATLGGSAKDWAQSSSLPDGTNKSAKSYASDAQTSASVAAAANKIYATTAAGLAAVASGEYFYVPSSTNGAILDLYKDNAGVAEYVKSVPSTEIATADTGSASHHAFTDENDLALVTIEDDGIHDHTSGEDVLLTGAPDEIDSNNATALFGREDSRHRTIEAIDDEGRPYWLGLGAVFDRVPTTDLANALMRESWGETTYKYYLIDKAMSALGRRVYIHKKLIADTVDSTSFARYPFYVPISDTTGVLLFAQRHSSQSNGEELQRQVCRSVTIDPDAGTITTDSTVTIDEPANWAGGTGGNAAGAVGVRIPSGAHSGRIVVVYNYLESNFYTDAAWEHALYTRYSDDNGATWSSGSKIMGKNQIYNTLTGGSGGIPGAVPSRNGVYTGTGNCIVRIPSGTYAGRIVCSIYTEGLYFGAMYSDDDGVTWTRGTLQTESIGGRSYSENAIAYCSDGSLVMLLRCDSNSGGTLTSPGSGRATSSDGGATWTFQEHESTTAFGNSSVSLINASLSSSTGFQKLLAACSEDTAYFNRQQHSLKLSYDKGSTWIAEVNFFASKQGVGYACLQRLSNGDYVFVYETFNGAGGINTQDSIGMIYFNEAELLASSSLI